MLAILAFTYRSGATGAFSALSGAGITIDNSSTPETATITPAAYNTLLGSNRTVTIRATRGTVYDQITVARINDGEAAITVVVSVTSGSLVSTLRLRLSCPTSRCVSRWYCSNSRC